MARRPLRSVIVASVTTIIFGPRNLPTKRVRKEKKWSLTSSLRKNFISGK